MASDFLLTNLLMNMVLKEFANILLVLELLILHTKFGNISKRPKKRKLKDWKKKKKKQRNGENWQKKMRDELMKNAGRRKNMSRKNIVAVTFQLKKS